MAGELLERSRPGAASGRWSHGRRGDRGYEVPQPTKGGLDGVDKETAKVGPDLRRELRAGGEVFQAELLHRGRQLVVQLDDAGSDSIEQAGQPFEILSYAVCALRVSSRHTDTLHNVITLCQY
jgi:hypothetical protein